MRPRPLPKYRRERLVLPDGDFLDLDWHEPRSGGPLSIILHGLAGCSRSHYVRGLVAALAHHGIRAVVMHQRGCSGHPNRLDRSYHAGETGDLATLLEQIRHREPNTPLGLVGYSLGGNIVLKWLGQNPRTSISAAAAISVPFLLESGVARMERGWSRAYQWRLVRLLRRSTMEKFAGRPGPISRDELAALRSFREFDDRVTAPLHGFANAAEYYRRSSSRAFLRSINTTALVIHALDDPMMSVAGLPTVGELSPTIRFELSAHGGHVGFVGGIWPWQAQYWLDARISKFLHRHLKPQLDEING